MVNITLCVFVITFTVDITLDVNVYCIDGCNYTWCNRFIACIVAITSDAMY